ncbi:hypothetical protein T265_14687, partial [Opisthorchis viverrini]
MSLHLLNWILEPENSNEVLVAKSTDEPSQECTEALVNGESQKNELKMIYITYNMSLHLLNWILEPENSNEVLVAKSTDEPSQECTEALVNGESQKNELKMIYITYNMSLHLLNWILEPENSNEVLVAKSTDEPSQECTEALVNGESQKNELKMIYITYNLLLEHIKTLATLPGIEAERIGGNPVVTTAPPSQILNTIPASWQLIMQLNTCLRKQISLCMRHARFRCQSVVYKCAKRKLLEIAKRLPLADTVLSERKQLTVFWRYADDTFVVMKRGMVSEFHSYLNYTSPHIKFSVEIGSTSDTLAFLEHMTMSSGEN